MSNILNTASQRPVAVARLIPISVMSDVLTISPQGPVAVARLILLYLPCGQNEGKKRKEMFYLTTHSTHSIYGYMASGIQNTNID